MFISQNISKSSSQLKWTNFELLCANHYVSQSGVRTTQCNQEDRQAKEYNKVDATMIKIKWRGSSVEGIIDFFFYNFLLCAPFLKVFIEFSTILFLVYVLVFWPREMWDLSSQTRDWTHSLCIGMWSLNHWTAREVPEAKGTRERFLGKAALGLGFDVCIGIYFCVSLVAQMVKNLPAMQETQGWSLGREGSLEKEMATHSSILVWRIPWCLAGYSPGGRKE